MFFKRLFQEFFWLFVFWLVATPAVLLAQQSLNYQTEDKTFNAAIELYNKEKYASAFESFSQYILQNQQKTNLKLIEAELYRAICATELFNDNAYFYLTEFIKKHPTHTKVKLAQFYLAKLLFREKDYHGTIKALAQTDVKVLDQTQQDEYYFRLGYAYFQTNQTSKAIQNFLKIKDKTSKFANVAKYYYAHLQYTQKHYDKALPEFKALTSDKNFGKIVPYYIAEIYLAKEQYDSVVSYVKPILDSVSVEKTYELNRLLGEAYYRKKEYNAAIPFLEYYTSKFSNPHREDFYHLAFSYYKNKQYHKAISTFEKVLVETEDSLAQNAYFHFAHCHLEKGNKRMARDAFSKTYQLKFNPVLQQEALYNMAKLSYEIDENPYNEAINAIQLYLEKYPRSAYNDELRSYLVQAFYMTRNYDEAIATIEKIKVKTIDIEKAYQHLVYFQGITFFNKKQYKSAIDYFNKAINKSYDKTIAAEALYWKAESYYQQKDFKTAADLFEKFLITPGAINYSKFNDAHYQIGYAYFNQSNYSAAQDAFQKFIHNQTNTNDPKIADASARLADCYLMQRKYENALEYYNLAIKQKTNDIDYAIYQKAIIQGVLGKTTDKIITLTNLINQYPQSIYNDDATYELGKTNLDLDKTKEANKYFNQLLTQHPESPLVPKTLLKIALIHYNNNDDEKALEIYKQILEKYPNTTEAQGAVKGMKNIYVENGNIEEFTSYIKKTKNHDLKDNDLDSLTYEAAFNKYTSGNCSAALKAFKDYIEKYPKGTFISNVQFYQAECHYQKQAFAEALKGYDYIVDNKNTQFIETALIKSARLYFIKQNFDKAIERYQTLELIANNKQNIIEAQVGLMRCYAEQQNFNQTIAYAKKIIDNPSVANDLKNEAYLMTGNSYLALKEYEKANIAYSKIANIDNEIGAEARYRKQEILFAQEQYEINEKQILNDTKFLTPYKYWLAKSFILLADNYKALNNNFQAKATLKSIIDNHKGQDNLVEIAKNKLKTIIDEENQKNKLKPTTQMEFDLEQK